MQEGGNIMRDVKNFLMDEDGQGMVEYTQTEVATFWEQLYNYYNREIFPDSDTTRF